MKKFLFFLFGLLWGVSAAEMYGHTTDPKDILPQCAQAFISSHFTSQDIVKQEKISKKVYRVMMSDSTQISFNKKGEWTSISNRETGVAEKNIPVPIYQKITKKFPEKDYVINSISRNLKEKNYRLKLSNNYTLVFDEEFYLRETVHVSLRVTKNGVEIKL